MKAKNWLSIIVGLAILALPAVTLAGHDQDQDDGPQPYGWHDEGRHRGWFKHRGPYALGPVEDEDDEDEDDQGEYGRLRPIEPPPLRCDEDGDDCEPNQGNWGDDGYGPPISYYRAAPPASYDLIRQRKWLLDHQRRAYNALTLMRARHDQNAMRRISTVIHGLDARIANNNRLLAERYSSASVPYYFGQANPNYDYLRANPYSADYGYSRPGYGYNPNSPASPSMNALTSMVGPLLGLPSR